MVACPSYHRDGIRKGFIRPQPTLFAWLMLPYSSNVEPGSDRFCHWRRNAAQIFALICRTIRFTRPHTARIGGLSGINQKLLGEGESSTSDIRSVMGMPLSIKRQGQPPKYRSLSSIGDLVAQHSNEPLIVIDLCACEFSIVALHSAGSVHNTAFAEQNATTR